MSFSVLVESIASQESLVSRDSLFQTVVFITILYIFHDIPYDCMLFCDQSQINYRYSSL